MEGSGWVSWRAKLRVQKRDPSTLHQNSSGPYVHKQDQMTRVHGGVRGYAAYYTYSVILRHRI